MLQIVSDNMNSKTFAVALVTLVLCSLGNVAFGADTKTQSTKGEKLEQDKYKTVALNTMLQWSSLSYSYYTLRDIVRENDSNRPENKGKKDTVAFEQPELILTQLYHGNSEAPYTNTFLKYPITASNIVKFIKLNKKYLMGDDGSLGYRPQGDGTDEKLTVVRRLSQLDDEFDAEIVEFDDEYSDTGFMGLTTELIYSIIVNKTEERVTVVFRGSANTKDFIIDAAGLKKTPPEIKEFAGGDVNIHMGFSNYLFGGTHEGKKHSKFDQIIDILKQVYAKKEYKGYDLYITGHSLGGGLTQLLGFALAGSPMADFIPRPINCVSYASPTAGNRAYYDYFRKLEKENKLRHIRVSNQGDVVAVMPSIGYHQTGINFHVDANKRVQIKHADAKMSLWSQMSLNSLSMHGLHNYHDRLFTGHNEDIINLDIEEIYQKYAEL